MKLRLKYQWMVWKPVTGSATVEIPDDLKGCRSIEDYVINNAARIVNDIADAKGIQPHMGDVSAGMETGYVRLIPVDPQLFTCIHCNGSGLDPIEKEGHAANTHPCYLCDGKKKITVEKRARTLAACSFSHPPACTI